MRTNSLVLGIGGPVYNMQPTVFWSTVLQSVYFKIAQAEENEGGREIWERGRRITNTSLSRKAS